MAETDKALGIKLLLEDGEFRTRFSAAFSQMEQSSKQVTNSMNIAWAGLASQFYLAQQAVEVVGGAMIKAITIAERHEDATHRLDIALQSQGFTTGILSQRYEDLSSSLANSTRFSKVGIDEMLATLVNLGNVGPNEIEGVAKATLNLATITGRDLPQAALIMSRAAELNVKALQRWGIILDENKSKAEQYAQLMQILSTKFGSAASEDVKSFSGEQAQLGKAIENVIVQLGDFIIKSPGVESALEGMAKKANQFAEALKKIREFNPDRVSPDDQAARNIMQSKGFNDQTNPSSESNFLRTLDNQKNETNEYYASIRNKATVEQHFMETQQKSHNDRMKMINDIFYKSEASSIIASTNLFKNNKAQEIFIALNAEKAKIESELRYSKITQEERQKLLLQENEVSAALIKLKQDQSKIMLAQELEKYKSQIEMANAVAGLSGALATATGSSALAGIKIVLEASTAAAKSIIEIQIALATAIFDPVRVAIATIELATIVVSAANAFSSINAAKNALKTSQADIPKLGFGGFLQAAGAVMVGDRGPEILNLPKGAQVTPLNNSGGGMTININFNGNIQASHESARQFARDVAAEVSDYIDKERRRL